MLTEWAVPGGREGAGWLAAWLVVVGLAVVLVTARRGVWRGETRRALLHAALVYGGCYTLVVVASRLFADPRILFDARMLMPVLVLATVLFVASAGELAREGGVRGWVIFGLATVVWLGAAVREDRAMVAAVNERGMYFTFVPWAVEPAVIWLEEASAAFEVVYSNEPALVHFLAGRHAKDLPVAGEDLASFERAFRAAPGAVVVFDPLQPSHLPADVFVRALGLHTVVRGSMGVVLAPAG
jgi:hypothetical protein